MSAAPDVIRAELTRVAQSLGAPDVVVELETPRDRAQGDVTTNLAMLLAMPLRQTPRRIAEQIVAAAKFPPDMVSGMEIAGPGVINFRLGATLLARTLTTIIAAGRYYGRQLVDDPLRINVEFAAALPTGPLQVAHGRAAVIGDCIATLLECQGHMVQRECYVNDAGEPVLRLGEALWARVQQAVGRGTPERSERNAWLGGLAQRLLTRHGWLFADQLPDAGVEACRKFAVGAVTTEQRDTLAACRVKVDVLFAETRLYTDHQVERVLTALGAQGVTVEDGGALWLRTTAWGEPADLVLRRVDGGYEAVVAELAYHDDRAVRGFDRAINVWDANHHGGAAWLGQALAVLGHADGFVAAVTVRPVLVVRGGAEVSTSPRTGEGQTLRELVEEVGADAARWYFLAERPESPLRLDVDLATNPSGANPLWYVQKAYARMAELFRAAGIDPARVSAEDVDFGAPGDPGAPELVRVLARFPPVVHAAAAALEPRQITDYCEALARAMHRWCDRSRNPVSGSAQQARLAVARAAQIVLTNALDLLGISAPGRLARTSEDG